MPGGTIVHVEYCGNLCRCTPDTQMYQAIKAAIAAEKEHRR